MCVPFLSFWILETVYIGIFSILKVKKTTGFGMNQTKVKCMFDKYPFSATERNL